MEYKRKVQRYIYICTRNVTAVGYIVTRTCYLQPFSRQEEGLEKFKAVENFPLSFSFPFSFSFPASFSFRGVSHSLKSKRRSVCKKFQRRKENVEKGRNQKTINILHSLVKFQQVSNICFQLSCEHQVPERYTKTKFLFSSFIYNILFSKEHATKFRI